MTATDFACQFCSGCGLEFDPDAGAVPCSLCDGSGYASAAGDLGPSRSERKRPYLYQPGCRRLTLGTGKRAAEYTVSEFTPDAGWDGRAFRMHKADGSDVYTLLIGPGGSHCDCAGSTYGGAARANFRAYLDGGGQTKTLGCKHLDCCYRLLATGWLDLPESVPATH